MLAIPIELTHVVVASVIAAGGVLDFCHSFWMYAIPLTGMPFLNRSPGLTSSGELWDFVPPQCS